MVCLGSTGLYNSIFIGGGSFNRALRPEDLHIPGTAIPSLVFKFIVFSRFACASSCFLSALAIFKELLLASRGVFLGGAGILHEHSQALSRVGFGCSVKVLGKILTSPLFGGTVTSSRLASASAGVSPFWAPPT